VPAMDGIDEHSCNVGWLEREARSEATATI